MNDKITQQLEAAGFDYAIAVATKAEVEAGAACGQLALLTADL
jgi:adenine C2-methylase RlmN of 23S rRNA A2503 and tRNA A37